jgi:hypothetical protein
VFEEQKRLARAGIVAEHLVLESRVHAPGQQHHCKSVAELLRRVRLFRGSSLGWCSWLHDASGHGGGRSLLLYLAFSARLGFVLAYFQKKKKPPKINKK